MNVIYAKFFYLTRLGNNIKIFIPLLTLLLRLNDPFFRKLVSKFINKHIYKINSSDIDLILLNDNTLIKKIVSKIERDNISAEIATYRTYKEIYNRNDIYNTKSVTDKILEELKPKYDFSMVEFKVN